MARAQAALLGNKDRWRIESLMSLHTGKSGCLTPTIQTQKESLEMRKARQTTKTMRRLELRIPLERKALLQHAAALRGITLTEFVVAAAIEAAVRTLQMNESMVLSSADSRAFSAAILHPMPTNARLARAAREYAKRFDDKAEGLKVKMVNRVFERATTVLGGEDNADIWMKSGLPVLGGKCPLELLTSIDGYETVIKAILARIASGTF